MNPPKISVLVPTFNYAAYLAEAIESVLAQDWDDFELIIADDASTDNSCQVISHYAAGDTRIRVHRHSQNLGMVANWNWCLGQARGEYVKFLFGDDKLLSPCALRKLASLLQVHSTATIAASARLVIAPPGAADLPQTWDEFGKAGLLGGRETIARCIDTGINLIGEPSAVMFRRAELTRGFSPAYRQLVDLEMWFALLEKGDLAYVPEPLCAFRKHDAQQTEANRRAGLHVEEAARLVWEYHRKPYLKPFGVRRLLFSQSYRLGKCHLNGHGLRIDQDIRAELGPFWYRACWLRHKLTRPWVNLRHSLSKRLKFSFSF